MPRATISDPSVKKKQMAKIYGLRTFANPRCPMDFSGAFRDNVREFLRECGDVEECSTVGMPTWCTLLVDEKSGVVVPLYTVEVCVRQSIKPFCDYCRCTGWSHHFVSKRRYHLIIPADDEWDKPLDSNVFDQNNHLLHGLIHCNGFGHLLCINGREGGSKFICGRDLMDLWDRICTSLHTREVTVEDESRKKSMDLRLLLGIAYGMPWFARWGYRFCLGSYGVTEERYKRSLDLLSSLDLDALIDEAADIGRARELRRVVDNYRKLHLSDPDSNPRLFTVRDLLRCLLEYKHRTVTATVPLPPKPYAAPPLSKKAMAEKRKRCRDFTLAAAEMASRWPERRLKVAAQVIVDALKDHGGMMTRQEVRDAARLSIGDTGLLDFVLKSLGNCVVGDRVVRRVPNPSTKVLEFTIEELDAVGTKPAEECPCSAPEPATELTLPSQSQAERDTVLVYKCVLGCYPEEGRAVLDSKHWVKRWPLRDEEDDRLRFLVRWMPRDEEMRWLSRALPPPEVVVVATHAAVGELREEAERAMRDTYCVMEGFRADGGVVGVAGEEWEPVLVGGAESGSEVWVSGEGAEVEPGELRYEGGEDNWTVDCDCGAKDDDGERMVACDVCEVWHHTRCIGIDDGDVVPPLFLCRRCGFVIMDGGMMV